jgi:hypothetical protein
LYVGAAQHYACLENEMHAVLVLGEKYRRCESCDDVGCLVSYRFQRRQHHVHKETFFLRHRYNRAMYVYVGLVIRGLDSHAQSPTISSERPIQVGHTGITNKLTYSLGKLFD